MIRGAMASPIIRAPAGAPAQLADPNAPTLVTCNQCGHQILVPTGIAQIAAQQHTQFCLGPTLRQLVASITPPITGLAC